MLLVKIEGDVYLTFTEFHSEIWIPKKTLLLSIIGFWSETDNVIMKLSENPSINTDIQPLFENVNYTKHTI